MIGTEKSETLPLMLSARVIGQQSVPLRIDHLRRGQPTGEHTIDLTLLTSA